MDTELKTAELMKMRGREYRDPESGDIVKVDSHFKTKAGEVYAVVSYVGSIHHKSVKHAFEDPKKNSPAYLLPLDELRTYVWVHLKTIWADAPEEEKPVDIFGDGTIPNATPFPPTIIGHPCNPTYMYGDITTAGDSGIKYYTKLPTAAAAAGLTGQTITTGSITLK